MVSLYYLEFGLVRLAGRMAFTMTSRALLSAISWTQLPLFYGFSSALSRREKELLVRLLYLN